MRKHVVVPAIAGFVLAAAWVGFANRQTLRDGYSRWKRGPVPEAVTRSQFAALDDRPEPSAVTGQEAKEADAKEPAEAAQVKPVEPAPADGSDAPSMPPAQVNLRMPFIPQAPFKVWDEVHEDTCEEASMLMVKAYLDGETSIALAEMERRMLDLVDFQEKEYDGDVRSIDAARTVEVMVNRLGIADVRVVPISSADDIRREIASGRPVILPASGKDLHNPNFKNGGPLYHMLVVKGYANGKFITNDPGTRLGEDYLYDPETLISAVHDWNDGDVLNGAKVMIVVGE